MATSALATLSVIAHVCLEGAFLRSCTSTASSSTMVLLAHHIPFRKDLQWLAHLYSLPQLASTSNAYCQNPARSRCASGRPRSASGETLLIPHLRCYKNSPLNPRPFAIAAGNTMAIFIFALLAFSLAVQTLISTLPPQTRTIAINGSGPSTVP